MLFINDQLSHVVRAKQIHVQLITCYLKRKLYGKSALAICADSNCKICKSKTQKLKISVYLFSVLKQIDLRQVAGGNPFELVKINNQFKNLYLKGKRKKISVQDRKSLEGIFNYRWFDNKENKLYNAYELCNNLRIETCIYCNRLYTSTVIINRKEMVIRPTLDHWFAQESHPLLSLSFYNLIPSCSPCNSSVKHDATFELSKNTHPFVDKGITNSYQIRSTYNTSLTSYKINVITRNKKIKSTLNTMKIAAIYEHHQSELADLDLLQRKYNKSYLKRLGQLLDAKLTEKEVYRIMFGVEYEDENFYKRPLSKLKKDILKLKLK